MFVEDNRLSKVSEYRRDAGRCFLLRDDITLSQVYCCTVVFS